MGMMSTDTVAMPDVSWSGASNTSVLFHEQVRYLRWPFSAVALRSWWKALNSGPDLILYLCTDIIFRKVEMW
jgi:hypothetical protein